MFVTTCGGSTFLAFLSAERSEVLKIAPSNGFFSSKSCRKSVGNPLLLLAFCAGEVP